MAEGEDAYPTDPFSDKDIERILAEERSSPDDGWTLVKRSDQAEVWKKETEGSPIRLIKGHLNFPGVPQKAASELIWNLEVRKKWDKTFSMIEEIEKRPNYRVLYWMFKMPIGISDRDLVQFSTKKDDSSGATFIIYKNATHPSRPEVPGVVRAETILSSTIIRPDEQDPENSSKVTILLQNDPKGWIPVFIINMMAGRAPFEWRDTLYNYYHNVYKKETEKKVEE